MIEELIEALEKIGHKFVAIYRSDDGLYSIYAFDEKLAKSKGYNRPVKEHYRLGDYKFLFNAWRDAGTYLLYADPHLGIAIGNSLNKLTVAS